MGNQVIKASKPLITSSRVIVYFQININDYIVCINLTNYLCLQSVTWGLVSFHKPSLRYIIRSRPTPLLTLRISSVLIAAIPTPIACSFPSAMIATTDPFLTSAIEALGWVSPGHMTWDPDRMCLIAPLSHLIWGIMKGYLCKILIVGIRLWSRSSMYLSSPLIK